MQKTEINPLGMSLKEIEEFIADYKMSYNKFASTHMGMNYMTFYKKLTGRENMKFTPDEVKRLKRAMYDMYIKLQRIIGDDIINEFNEELISDSTSIPQSIS
jgi:hypothetical protein